MNRDAPKSDASHALASLLCSTNNIGQKPNQFCTRQAKLSAMIEFATKVKNWPLLAQAVDAKIEDQAEFVRWWDGNVGSRHGLNGSATEGARAADRFGVRGYALCPKRPEALNERGLLDEIISGNSYHQASIRLLGRTGAVTADDGARTGSIHMKLPTDTEIQIAVQGDAFFVFLARPPFKANTDLLRDACQPGRMTTLITHDEGVIWSDPKGELLVTMALEHGEPVIMQFETMADALAALDTARRLVVM